MLTPTSVKDALHSTSSGGGGAGAGMGAHPARFEGFLIHRTERRFLPAEPADYREKHAPKLRRGAASHHRRLHRGARRARRIAGQRTKLGSGRGFHRDHRCVGRHLSAAEKGAHAGIPARDRPPASALESFRLRLSRPEPARFCHSPVFPGARFCLRAHTDHHGKRLRRRRRIVSRHDARREESAASA